MEWNRAVQEPAKKLGDAARKMREEMRRGLLAPYAPVSVVNDWWEDQLAAMPAWNAPPLPDVHPAVARGIVTFLKEGRVLMTRKHSDALRPWLRSFDAIASGA